MQKQVGKPIVFTIKGLFSFAKAAREASTLSTIGSRILFS
jgi:hypothetical protein